MRSLLDLDKVQLTRIDQAIAAIAAMSAAERLKKICLLEALEDERQELIRCNPAVRLALKDEITFEAGHAMQHGFRDYPLLTIAEMPKVEIFLIPSRAPPTGAGEAGVPPIAPAVANAIFALTGKRLRSLPLRL